VNWCQHWFEYFPNPPLNVLSMAENVLAHHDKELLQHLIDCGVTSQVRRPGDLFLNSPYNCIIMTLVLYGCYFICSHKQAFSDTFPLAVRLCSLKCWPEKSGWNSSITSISPLSPPAVCVAPVRDSVLWGADQRKVAETLQ
jgi:hypothetical protein